MFSDVHGRNCLIAQCDKSFLKENSTFRVREIQWLITLCNWHVWKLLQCAYSTTINLDLTRCFGVVLEICFHFYWTIHLSTTFRRKLYFSTYVYTLFLTGPLFHLLCWVSPKIFILCSIHISLSSVTTFAMFFAETIIISQIIKVHTYSVDLPFRYLLV
jgi:hypothetical protein